MADVLSQSQIDALLNSINSPEAAEEEGKVADDENRKIKKYDFKTPKKFTRDRLKLLFSVYENFARVVSSYLTSMMRLSCQIEMVDIEEQKYFEFNNALSENDIVAMLDGSVNDGKNESETLMIQMSNSVIYALIDRMIGGTGDASGTDTSTGFTDIEIYLFENIMVHILPLMEESWQSYFDVNFKFDKVETNPRLIQSISADEIVVIVVLNIEMNESSGTFNICVPGSILESLFKLSEQAAQAARKKDHGGDLSKDEILSSLKDSSLQIRAFLGEANILLEDVYSLKPGDVINLKKPKESEIAVYVEDKPWYKGRLGEKKGNVAVKITGTTLSR